MIFNRKDWATITLNEACDFIRGVVFSTKDEVDSSDNVILRSHNVDFENSKITLHNLKYVSDDVKLKKTQKITKCDILISVANSKEQTGKMGFAFEDINAYAGGFMAILRAKEIIHPFFLFNYLLTNRAKNFIAGRTQGTTNIFNITFERIKDLRVPLPSIKEQRQIGLLFELIETAIDNADKQNRSLLKIKNALLDELFSEHKRLGTYLNEMDFESVRFDKVANNISERVEPQKTALVTYVGLEHLEADNLRIERTGVPDDVTGTKLKIYKGDIIFGKRRAYLRKIAVSHFDGIASAHSMILRADERFIEKDFLPYFMQSNTFMSRAVEISEGSLSPTIKNSSLAKQEFWLPKKEKQQRLITIFKQLDVTMDELRKQKNTLKNLKQKLLNDILG